MAAAKTKTVDLTTGVGILSFPRVFKETAGKKDDGSASYDIQIIIPKKVGGQINPDAKAIMRAIREVGIDRWGDKWKSVRTPLRDGDKEKDELTEDGTTTKGEKYPERLGCYFMNARSGKPVAVVGRDRSPIDEPSDVYGGCKGKIAVNFYAYATNGNFGIAAGLNGVQKISDGEPLATGGAPAVESMFDMLDTEDDLGLDEEDDLDDDIDEEPEPPKKKATAKKAAAKKAPARRAKPEPVDEDEDDLDEDEDDEDDLLDDLDDEDA